MALEELSFESVDGQTDNGQKVITIAHPEHSSGELKKQAGQLPHPPPPTHLLVCLSLLTMTNPNQLCDVLLFVCSKMADETTLSSKLPVADRTREV